MKRCENCDALTFEDEGPCKRCKRELGWEPSSPTPPAARTDIRVALGAIEKEIAFRNSASGQLDQEDWRWKQGFVSGLHKAHSIVSLLSAKPSNPSPIPAWDTDKLRELFKAGMVASDSQALFNWQNDDLEAAFQEGLRSLSAPIQGDGAQEGGEG